MFYFPVGLKCWLHVAMKIVDELAAWIICMKLDNPPRVAAGHFRNYEDIRRKLQIGWMKRKHTVRDPMEYQYLHLNCLKIYFYRNIDFSIDLGYKLNVSVASKFLRLSAHCSQSFVNAEIRQTIVKFGQ